MDHHGVIDMGQAHHYFIAEKFESVIGDFLFTNRQPMREDVINMMKTRPKLKERATTAERLIQKVTHYVDTFVSGMGG